MVAEPTVTLSSSRESQIGSRPHHSQSDPPSFAPPSRQTRAVSRPTSPADPFRRPSRTAEPRHHSSVVSLRLRPGTQPAQPLRVARTRKLRLPSAASRAARTQHLPPKSSRSLLFQPPSRADPCSSSRQAEPIPAFPATQVELIPAFPAEPPSFLEPPSFWSFLACPCPGVLGIPLGIIKDQLVPAGVRVARVRGRASYGVETEVGARASWRATRSDRGEP
ncbi:hypothetical protein E5676_scaffold32G00060 [Cucumis melo var. makuwa]|uniref:Uncharacterized protein n=1 Tax=Cucumis melo var. makuwa TaxID=1194695 RepID=A0A5D3CVS2_CUCMM|nr:hypothetical protein E5676_scaffold32G00060 [Cucumis melo var. makuwa]